MVSFVKESKVEIKFSFVYYYLRYILSRTNVIAHLLEETL